LTWHRGNQSLRLYVSRDERRARRRARPPDLHVWGGLRVLAPIDPGREGTWLGVNEHGLAVTLLNGALASPPHARATPPSGPGRISRGRLVRDLLACADWNDAEALLRDRSLEDFAAFTLVAFPSNRAPRVACWDEAHVELRELGDEEMPLASSSFDPDGVPAVRREVFEQLRDGQDAATSDALDAFHRSHLPHRGAYSPCMHREDAVTVSYTVAEITPRRARMDYVDGPPCEQSQVFRRDLRL
jgi:hypothetical protein